jgi:hypothetical protein
MVLAQTQGVTSDCPVVTSIDILDLAHHRPTQVRYVILRQGLIP